MPKTWYLYILQCRDGSYYTGISTNPQKRLDAHNNGEACDYTSRRRPVRLVYTESHPDKSSARKRELEVKGWSQNKKKQLIEKGTEPVLLRVLQGQRPAAPCERYLKTGSGHSFASRHFWPMPEK